MVFVIFLFYLSLGEKARIKGICQNLECDIEIKSLEYDEDAGMELNLLFFSIFVLE